MDVINDTIMVNINLEPDQDDSIVEVVSYIGSMRSVLNIFRGQDAHDMYHILMNPNLLKVHKYIIKNRLSRDDSDSFMKKEFYIPSPPESDPNNCIVAVEELEFNPEICIVDNEGLIHETEQKFINHIYNEEINKMFEEDS